MRPFCFTFKVISSIRIKHPNYDTSFQSIMLPESDPLFEVYFSRWLTYYTPIYFQTYTGRQRCTRHQAFVPLHYWGTIHIWYKTWRAGKRGTEQIWEGWNSPGNCPKYRVHSSFLCFLTWKGAQWKTPPSRLPLPGPLLLYAANQRSVIWIYFIWVVKTMIF